MTKKQIQNFQSWDSGYFKKFIYDYVLLTRPLSELLKKDEYLRKKTIPIRNRRGSSF